MYEKFRFKVLESSMAKILFTSSQILKSMVNKSSISIMLNEKAAMIELWRGKISYCPLSKGIL